MIKFLSKYPPSIFKLSENFLEVSFPFEKAYLEELEEKQVTGQVTGQVTKEVKKLIVACNGKKTRNELMDILNLKGRDNFEKLYLKLAIKQELIELTIPDKPNSRLQKYRLTEKGVEVKKTLEKEIQNNLKGLKYDI